MQRASARSASAQGQPFSRRRIAAVQRLRRWEANRRRVRVDRCVSVDDLLRRHRQGELHVNLVPLLAGKNPVLAEQHARARAAEAEAEVKRLQAQGDQRRLRARIEAAQKRVQTALREAARAAKAASEGVLLRFRSQYAEKLLGLVAYCCIDQGHEAILGALPKLAQYLQCDSKSLRRCLEELAEDHYLVREDRFRSPQPADKWRDGKPKANRELVPAVRPGGTLREVYGRWKNGIQHAAQVRALRERRAFERQRKQQRRQRKQAEAPRRRWQEDLDRRRALEARTSSVDHLVGHKIQPSEIPPTYRSGAPIPRQVDQTHAGPLGTGGVDSPPVTTHLTGDLAPVFWAERVARVLEEQLPEQARGLSAASRQPAAAAQGGTSAPAARLIEGARRPPQDSGRAAARLATAPPVLDLRQAAPRRPGPGSGGEADRPARPQAKDTGRTGETGSAAPWPAAPLTDEKGGGRAALVCGPQPGARDFAIADALAKVQQLLAGIEGADVAAARLLLVGPQPAAAVLLEAARLLDIAAGRPLPRFSPAPKVQIAAALLYEAARRLGAR